MRHSISSFRWILMFLLLVLIIGCSENTETPPSATQTKNDLSPTAVKTIIQTDKIPQLTFTPHSYPSKTVTESPPTVTQTPLPPTITLSPIPELWSVVPGRIAFLDARNNKIRLIDTNGNDLGIIANTNVFIVDALAWSPDGKWLAFGNHPSEDEEIYRVKPDGSNLERLTDLPHGKYNLSWSNDGHSIAYIDDGGTGLDTDIVVLNLEEATNRKLTRTLGMELNPSWSPDGRMISFLYRESITPYAELLLMSADGSNRKKVTQEPVVLAYISWSPDGKKITFSSGRNGCGDLFVINADGSNLTQLTDLPGCAHSPTWSPDGRHIAFNASEITEGDVFSMNWQIYIMNANGTGLTQLTTNSNWVPLFPKWAPVPALIIGKEYEITEAGDNLNLRDSPTLSGDIITKLITGDVITILEGPIDADDYYWWRMSTSDGTEGWAVEWAGWYKLFD